MLHINWIIDNQDVFDAAMKARGEKTRASDFVKLKQQSNDYISQKQEYRTQQNQLAKTIGLLRQQNRDVNSLIDESIELKNKLANMKDDEASWKLHDLLLATPNILDSEVPFGKDEADNVVLYHRGIKPETPAIPHYEVTPLMDFETASNMSGSRFVVLRGELARLERALGQFMLDFHTSHHGYEEVSVPVIVKEDALYGTGQLPKFKKDLYKVNEKYLIPTAEVPLTNLKAHCIDEKSSTYRFTALTPCFRSEAGAAGKDVRGMIRQHQFNKVELVSITPEESAKTEFNHTLSSAEAILQQLGLHYRVVRLCSGDTGFASKLTYDIEVWLPGANAYREISSISWFGDFQARALNMMYREDKNTKHYHTVNGSGLAVGRTLIAILENYQTAEGIKIPDALLPYTNGVKFLLKGE